MVTSPTSDPQTSRAPFEWTKALTLHLIELYRQRPCLWNVKCEEYRNRDAKYKAYEELYNDVKSLDPLCTVEIVKKKLNTLRSQYRKEVKQISTSKKSGASADDVYLPKLWCFNHLKFLNDGESQSVATSNMDPVEVSLLL